MKKILFATRDVGAASHFAPLIRHMDSKNICEYLCFSQQPAYSYLISQGIETSLFKHPVMSSSQDHYFNIAQESANKIIESYRPDAILVGGAHFGEIGVEELFLQCPNRPPTYYFQDFWGGFNRSASQLPDAFLVLDEFSARVTRTLYLKPAYITGPLKYVDYSLLNLDLIRNKQRSKLLVADDVKLVGFFGQALSHLNGYQNTIKALVDDLISLKNSYKLEILFKPHPRESRKEVNFVCNLINGNGIKMHLITEKDIVTPLVSCDLIVSCFSTCALDMIYVNFYSQKPRANSVYLMFDPSISNFFYKSSELTVNPLVRQGLVQEVVHRNELKTVIDDNLGAGSNRTWLNSKRLPGPSNNIETCLSILNLA